MQFHERTHLSSSNLGLPIGLTLYSLKTRFAHRKRTSRIPILVALALSLALFSASAFAQFEKSTISGTVTDLTGAVVGGATVTVTNVGTGAERTATTSDRGYYSVTDLAPSTYDVKVSSKSFSDSVKRIAVAPGIQSTVDLTLALQGTQTVVEVTGTSDTHVDTESSSLSQVVSEARVSQLPTLTRDPYDFVQTVGNVSQDSASGTGGRDQIVRGSGVSINGMRSSSTDALLDGAENVDAYTTQIAQPVPQDAVQEFSIVTSNFGAEYGRASGGVLNVVTKSGTNGFHGDLFELNRVSKLTSNDYDSNAHGQAKGKYARNQFGYAIGGPIKRDKLFFFSSTEWTRVRSHANVVQAGFDPAFLAASNSATQSLFGLYTLRPGLKVLQALNATNSIGFDPANPNPKTPTFNTYATANGGNNPVFDIIGYQPAGDAGGGNPQNTYNTFQRVDFNLSDKTTMYGRYDLLNLKQFDGVINTSPFVGFDTGTTQKYQNFLYSLTHVWTPSMVSESKISFNRLKQQQPLNPKQPLQPSLYFNANVDPTIQGNLICLTGYSCTTPGNSIPFGGPQNVGELAQSLNWTKGNHTLHFGGQYIYTRDNRTFGAYENAVQALEFGGASTLDTGLDNALTGQAGWFQVVIDPQGKFPCVKDVNGVYNVTPACSINLPAVQPSFARSNRYNDFAFYGQDGWKVSRRLTLNLGLRWEYYGVQHNKDPKLDSNFVFGTGTNIFDKIRNGQVNTIAATPNSPASPVGGLWRKNLHNFAPRVGFAYDLFGDGKTSLRGGYGISYERNFGNVTFNVIQNPPAQFNGVFQGEQPIQSTNLGPFAGSTGTKFLPNPSLRYVRQDLPTAYNESYNLSLQREVLHNSLIALEYSGSHGIHLYSIENLNQRGFGVVYEGTDFAVNNPIDRLNRQYGNMNTRGGNGFSNYNSLNTRFTTNNLFHQGLDLTVNYTFAHTIDNLSSTFSETPQTENLGLLDPFQPGLDRGPADFDARHRVAISAVWTLPYAKGTHGIAKKTLDGWSMSPIITARTGNPFTVFDSTNNIGDTVSARYQFAPGTSVPRTGSTSTVATNEFAGANSFNYLSLPVIPASAVYFDPLVGSGELPTCDTTTNGAGDLVSTGQNCKWPSNMVGRNSFRGPGSYNINIALRKAFPITERVNLQFSGEFYNLLNHSNYYVQGGATNDVGNNGNVYSNNIFQVAGKRGVNPAAGVPNERRFIQFSLKLSF